MRLVGVRGVSKVFDNGVAALAGVAVTRASDGTLVSDFAALAARRAAATPSRRTAVVFMRSFG